MLRTLLSRIEATVHRHRREMECDEEMQAHLDMLAERFIRLGMRPDEALYAARRQFGGLTQMKEDLRTRRALPRLDILVQDVRHAFRQLRRARGFTISAALTLALGIGATTAVFAVLDNVVLRPLPYPGSDTLIAFHSMDRRGTPHPAALSYPTFFDFRRNNRVFEHLVSYRDSRFTLTDSLPAVQVLGEVVSWDLFALLGVQPELGRGFLPYEEERGKLTVVLSHGLWQSRFGGDPAILGRRIRMNGRSFTVVGVAPPGFRFPIELPDVELWTTLADDGTLSQFTPLTEQRGARVLDAIGRLKRGITVEQATTQMDQIAGVLASQYPDENKNVPTTSLVPELQRVTGRSRKPLLILLGAVGLVLMIACANVANLLLVRSTERTREFTLRTAIGASASALVRQLLIESLALGFVGTAAGILVASGMLKLVLPLAGESIPRLADTAVDVRVLAFSAVVAILTTVLFSIAPAIQVLRSDAAGALKESAASIVRGHHWFRNSLVVAQVTLGLVLLIGAELLMAGFLRLIQRDVGFQPANLLTFDIGSPSVAQDGEIAFCDRLLERLRAIPGVKASATGTPLPLAGSEMSVSFDIEERPAPPAERSHSDMAIVTPGYFNTMRIRLLNGRDFTEHDDVNGPRVVIVNEAFARKYFPGENALGKRIKPGATNGKEGMVMREIVGVVGNAKQVPLSADPDPIYYFPYKQLPWGIGTVVLRTDVPPLEVLSAARKVIESLDAQVPMFQVRTGKELASRSVAPLRFLTTLLGSFAAIALLLTAAGLYGVLSYSVARRRREIGVRIALGAAPVEVVRLVVRHAALLVLCGLILGFGAAFGAGRVLQSMIFGVAPAMPAIAVGAVCLMVAISAVAAYVPASRAASVDPMAALRTE